MQCSNCKHYNLFCGFVLLTSLLCACTLAVPRPSNIQLLDISVNNLEGAKPWYITDGMSDEEVELYLSGIYSLRPETVFLYGSFVASPGIVRSTLLRSSNGGHTWQEVMVPRNGSYVIQVDFVDDIYGWAIVMESVESPGDMYIYSTTDGGKIWTPLAKVDNRFLAVPRVMNFKDRLKGELIVENDIGQGFTFFETLNGGKIWQETKTIPIYSYEREGKEYFSRGSDGSEWQYVIIDESKSEQIRVERRLNPEADWTIMSSIPVYYRYSNGKVFYP